MRTMVVAPGPTTSTFDIYWYTLRALDRLDVDSFGFASHSRITYHQIGKRSIEDLGLSYTVSVIGSTVMDVLGAVADTLPDVVHVVDGSLFGHHLMARLRRLSESMADPFVVSIHMTEEPYSATGFEDMRKYAHVVFVNDAYAVSEFDPDGSKMVYWMPHAYDPEVHSPNLDYDSKDIDLLFVGTVYPERVPYLKADWGDMVCVFGGSDLGNDVDLSFGNVSNDELAKLYRRSKICLNKHREMGSVLDESQTYRYPPHAVSPRVVEAMACGCVVLTDHRPELDEIGKDAVLLYSNVEDAVGLARDVVQDRDAWTDIARRARSAIESRKYDTNVSRMLDIWDDALKLLRR